jgi:hypothetical protein
LKKLVGASKNSCIAPSFCENASLKATGPAMAVCADVRHSSVAATRGGFIVFPTAVCFPLTVLSYNASSKTRAAEEVSDGS